MSLYSSSPHFFSHPLFPGAFLFFVNQPRILMGGVAIPLWALVIQGAALVYVFLLVFLNAPPPACLRRGPVSSLETP